MLFRSQTENRGRRDQQRGVTGTRGAVIAPHAVLEPCGGGAEQGDGMAPPRVAGNLVDHHPGEQPDGGSEVAAGAGWHADKTRRKGRGA